MNRRTFLRSGAFGLAVAAATPYRLFSSPPDLAVERVYASMGTVVRFQVYHEDPSLALSAIHEAASRIQRIHELMSVQESGSELARWNRSRSGLDDPFDELTSAALTDAFRLMRDTDGRFDPTVGAAVRAYERGAPVVPQDDRAGSWDPDNRRFEKVRPDIRLDLDGSAKGWAVDQAMTILQGYGITSALVNAGGDLRVSAPPPGTSFWRIGIRDPRAPDELLGVLRVRDTSIATSGDYEKTGSTLVDPRDLSQVRLRGGVTVITSDCGTADGYATALCVDPNLSLLPESCKAVIVRESGGEFVQIQSEQLHFELDGPGSN